jgi:GxxExxY protein
MKQEREDRLSNSSPLETDEKGVNRQDAKTPRKKNEPGAELDRLAHDVIGAVIEAHRALGPGLLESVYEEALCLELTLRRVPFARQVIVSVEYKENLVGEARLDLLVSETLILELKAVESIAPIHFAQLLSYLKITRLRLGLLINFNVPEVRSGIKRVINT